MRIVTHIDQATRPKLLMFLERLAAADARKPLSEYKEVRLGEPGVIERLLLTSDGKIVGYSQAAWHRPGGGSEGHWAIEVAVEGSHRKGGAAGELIKSLSRHLGDARLTLWAHSDYVARAADAGQWTATRTLLEMTRALPFGCPQLPPPGLELTTFRPGIDESAWIRANNMAFSGHPENGALILDDVERRLQQPWFDPDGFFIVWDGDQIAGSCWTKVHEDGVGEIYIISVVPAWEGRGLGKILLCAGLRYLGDVRGAPRVRLYVESDNERAQSMYEELDFEVCRRITAYSR